MLWAGVVSPLAGADAFPSTFGCDDQTGGVGEEGLGDELLADVGAVGVGGVDEVHVELDCATECGERAWFVLWRTPDAVAGDAHGAVAEAIYCQVAADCERSCCRCT